MKLVAKSNFEKFIKGVTYHGVRVGHGKVLVRIGDEKFYVPLGKFKIKKD